MNGNTTFRPGEREFAIQLRSLLLKCVDLLEKTYMLGKYKPSKGITISPSDSIAGAISTPASVSEEVSKDEFSSV